MDAQELVQSRSRIDEVDVDVLCRRFEGLRRKRRVWLVCKRRRPVGDGPRLRSEGSKVSSCDRICSADEDVTYSFTRQTKWNLGSIVLANDDAPGALNAVEASCRLRALDFYHEIIASKSPGASVSVFYTLCRCHCR